MFIAFPVQPMRCFLPAKTIGHPVEKSEGSELFAHSRACSYRRNGPPADRDIDISRPRRRRLVDEVHALTVRRHVVPRTPIVPAVSSTEHPPKVRSSTTWLGRGSSVASSANASFSATTSTAGAEAVSGDNPSTP